jgi:hypothetical protein
VAFLGGRLGRRMRNGFGEGMADLFCKEAGNVLVDLRPLIKESSASWVCAPGLEDMDKKMLLSS